MVRQFFCGFVFLVMMSCGGKTPTKNLRLGFEPAFFSKNEQTTRMHGFFQALIPLIEKKSGYLLEFIESVDEESLDLLDRKMVDVVFSDVNKNRIHTFKWSFSVPVLYNGYYLVTQKEDTRTLCELDGKRVLVLNSAVATDLIACYPRVDFAFYAEGKEAYINLSKTLCSGLLVPASDFPTFMHEFQVSKERFTEQYFHFIAREDDHRFKAVANAIYQLDKDGTIAALKKKWMLEP